jgi:hypothetical protein
MLFSMEVLVVWPPCGHVLALNPNPMLLDWLLDPATWLDHWLELLKPCMKGLKVSSYAMGYVTECWG